MSTTDHQPTGGETDHLTNVAQARRRTRAVRFVRPLQEFARFEAAGGLVIIGAVVLALIAANTGLSGRYNDLVNYELALDLNFFSVEGDLHFWINDVAMVLFFFVVGLEIKREIVVGELSSFRRLATPLAAALGGVIVPVLIFVLIVDDPIAREGWAIPMATDIAIAIGIVSLLGSRVPVGLRVLLLAVAIIDDIGAISVIAVFYTDSLDLNALALVIGLLGLIWILNQVGVRPIAIYVALGAIAWGAIHESGIHPTILGVTLGLMTPWRPWFRTPVVPDLLDRGMHRLRDAVNAPTPETEHGQEVGALLTIAETSLESVSPLDRLEHTLLPWSAFVVVPIFAFVNSGVDLRGGVLEDAASSSVALGVGLGLLIGKPIGFMLGAWLAVRFGATLPEGATWLGVMAMGVIAGIGFTVAIFVTELSYTDELLLIDAKVGILFASLFAGIAGLVLLRIISRSPRSQG